MTSNRTHTHEEKKNTKSTKSHIPAKKKKGKETSLAIGHTHTKKKNMKSTKSHIPAKKKKGKGDIISNRTHTNE